MLLIIDVAASELSYAFSVGSETGEWVLDETPRAMCCKVIVYHTVHFTRHCDYNISYCNATSPTPVVYASPLPPPLAKQIGQAWTVSFQIPRIINKFKKYYTFCTCSQANFVCQLWE